MAPLKERWETFLENHSDIERMVNFLSEYIPPINFITIHYIYFIVGSLVASGIFWGSSNPHGSISYIDSLFMATSSLTNTGLNTVNLSTMTTWQQVMIWFLLIIGSPIWVSWWTVVARLRAFEARFDHIVEAEKERRRRSRLRQTGPKSILPFRRFLSLDRFKSGGSSSALPGLGTRLPAEQEKTAGAKTVNVMGVPIRRMTSVAEESASTSSGSRASTLTAEHIQTADPTSATASARPPSNSRPPATPVTPNGERDHISFAENLPRPSADISVKSGSAYQHHGIQASPQVNIRPPSSAGSVASNESDFITHWKHILTKHNTGKRGEFYDLTTEERDILGGCEYRALKILAVAVPLYEFGWMFICSIALAAWIKYNAPGEAAAYDQNPIWSGIFLSISAFNNGGMSIIDAGMSPFVSKYFVLIVVGLLVLAGNTAYPIFLRFIFWLALKIMQLTTGPNTLCAWKDTVEFILKYPRRVYTTLFASNPTWWLFGILILINIIDWVAFEVLNLTNSAVTDLSVGDRVIVGLFQAISVRAAGFACVSIEALYPTVQVLYIVMMYISVYPVTVTMRHSNVYEERSLGIYEDDPVPGGNDADDDDTNGRSTGNDFLSADGPTSKNRLRRAATGAANVGKGLNKGVKRVMTFHGVGVQGSKNGEENSRVSFISQQIRGQLAHDMWWLVLPLLAIMLIETDHFLDQPVTYSIFNVMFEVVSAYGCVGLSVGIPTNNYSFSGGWHPGSKFILCLVMLRGRHRGLPVALDKAVRLPGVRDNKEEEEDFQIRRAKTLVGPDFV